jgi:hypothetical protein
MVKNNIWRQEHLDEIQRVFSEQPYKGDTHQLLVHSGQRDVVRWIKQQVDKNRNKGITTIGEISV